MMRPLPFSPGMGSWEPSHPSKQNPSLGPFRDGGPDDGADGGDGQGRQDGLASTGAGWHVTGQGTRARFISFSFQNTKRPSLNFLEHVFSHLESHGALFEETIYLQTDWGAEYGGHQTKSVKRYHQDLNQLNLKRTSPFTHLHTRKGKPEDNGFVERSHRTDDEEFYRLEKRGFKDLQDFMLKASEWIYYYNYDRSHDGLGGKSPAEAL